MLTPPFKLSTSLGTAVRLFPRHEHEATANERQSAAKVLALPQGRGKLTDLNPHLHCSVIGTCLGTSELRKIMARFMEVRDASDLDVHHEAVRLTSEGSVAKALQKALDQRHQAVVQRFSQTHDAAELASLWDDALRQGEIPGAYWAVLTHRDVTADLRQKVFGDVHMLSHLVGAANRADIRRLVALEAANTELHERIDRQQLRSQEQLAERDRTITQLALEVAAARSHDLKAMPVISAEDDFLSTRLGFLEAQVALQTERRERAEQASSFAASEMARLQEELNHVRRQMSELGRELRASEDLLRGAGDGQRVVEGLLDTQLRGRSILYVGGRPSTAPAIRDLVQRHGGDFERHDGGLEDRKGLLAAAVARAHLVVFPVDCIDHDSMGNLKRICARHGVAFIPLRSASIGSFAAALAPPEGDGAKASGPPICRRHG